MKVIVLANVLFFMVAGLNNAKAESPAPETKQEATKASAEDKSAKKEMAKAADEAAKAEKVEKAAAGPDMREPDALIKDVSGKILGQLKDEKGETKSLKDLHELFSDELMPVVAINRIARVVMSSQWKNASKSQRQKFTDVFSTSLILFYAKAFAQYNNEPINYLKPTINKKKRAAVIPSEVALKNSDPLSVVYSLRQTKSGEWKVVDIIVEGVSLVRSKRDEFSGLFAKEGLDSVIAKLEASNSKALEG